MTISQLGVNVKEKRIGGEEKEISFAILKKVKFHSPNFRIFNFEIERKIFIKKYLHFNLRVFVRLIAKIFVITSAFY